VNAFTIAGTALIAGIVPCGWVLIRGRDAADALVALELCGTLTTLAFLCLALGFNSSSYFTVPIICAAVTWVGGVIGARLIGRL
jgi:multisubunit Na+/H+ antiporter MnhF subunit